MNLKQANEKMKMVELRGSQLRPGTVSIEKIIYDRLVSDN